MKFGKRLQSQVEETLPEWRDKYLSYKQLKKRLKQLSAPECFAGAAHSSPEHEATANVPQEEASASPHDIPGNLSPSGNLSEGQDSSANGFSNSGAKSSSSSVDGIVSDCIHPDLAPANLSAEEVDFIHLLNAELEKFNTFFIEKEEEYVIRLQELKERCEQLRSESDSLNEEMINIRKDIVNFHGEMVLLENYSSLNYTGLVKILKKHDKRTGALLRMPFIRNVLQQPFFTTELLSKLVQECETNLHSLFPSPQSETGKGPRNVDCPVSEGQQQTTKARQEGYTAVHEASNDKKGPACAPSGEHSCDQGGDVDTIYRSTLAALRTMKELRRGSSTYNIFSLPPLNKAEGEDGVNGFSKPCLTTNLSCSDK
ncbi:hypothetical protein KP509_13G084600 [Ceratopteris richardii]|uniref:SPX domain-containing protein n=1 Tax=Ceratopteris richardii TaxID=49495 RepID=A0A8T2TH95_CERRI|nr:hypothetical protein KP509_13G084600 [Ceratopteris richardii]KAH7421983.1 hypothetical protein KP509_13G084600 [Ceratopteris richardii]